MTKYIKWPNIKSCTLDALSAATTVPYETWHLNPPNDKLLPRLDEECKHTKTAFLLTGRPRMGKSTMVKKLVNAIGPHLCGGFYTEEITNSGERIGFRCVSISGESVEIANVENPSKIRVGRYGIDVNQFESFAIQVLEDALLVKKVIVIDEIGFMQMLSASFQKKIQEIFSGNHVVLGTVPVDSHPEIDKIKYAKSAKIIGLNERNRDSITAVLVKDILRALDSSR